MACFEDLLRRFKPRDGVMYLPYIHNQKARKLAEQYSPPLTIEAETFALFIDICDVHQRRNVNRSVDQLMAAWPEAVERARQQGITQGSIGIASAWGSNFMGKFSPAYRFPFSSASTRCSRRRDRVVETTCTTRRAGACRTDGGRLARDQAPVAQVKQFHLPCMTRGGWLPRSTLLRSGPDDTVILEGTLGGIGGGQFGGNGRASGMAPTEDLLHMLEGMGIETGVNLDKTIDCVWMLERIIGRPAFGHVSKAGPRPATPEALYDANLPGLESLEAAKHFKLGPAAYAKEGYFPWKEPIAGPFHRID
jgi:hydroxymethylglutaryl-CoA lyase